MKTVSAFSRQRTAGSRRGQALVEFAIAALVLLMLIFGVIEIARIFLVYTTITDAARQGVRYAITHGTPPAGPTTTGSATNNINAAGLTINTTFPNMSCAGATPSSACSGTTPGNLVQVTVSYPYDLLISYFPINVTLAGTSQGVITW